MTKVIKVSKKTKEAQKVLDTNKLYTLGESVSALKSIKMAKFDETLDVAINLGVDTKHSDQMVRGVMQLPFGTGKNIKVAVICKDERIAEAKNAGADLCGSEELITDIKAGKINFDVCIATPDMMGVIGSVAKILGPKGLMPNPKLGTVTIDITQAVKNAKGGQVEFRADKSGVVHAGVGKMSFKESDLQTNLSSFVSAISKAKPSGVKGTYIKSIYVSSTMSPSIKIDLSSLSS